MIEATTRTPFRTACPRSAMKPTAALTDRGMRAAASPRTPPMRASGTFSMMRAQSHTEPKAENSRRKVRRSDSGITSCSRAMARSWFSNSPPQVISYPAGSDRPDRTRARASCTNEPMSRSRTFMRMPT